MSASTDITKVLDKLNFECDWFRGYVESEIIKMRYQASTVDHAELHALITELSSLAMSVDAKYRDVKATIQNIKEGLS